MVLNHLTAYQLLTRAVGLKAGQAAFIYGLAGGLGSAMGEVAKVLGIELFGTASGGPLEQARRGVAFDRDDPRWTEAARAARRGGFDAVFDPLGGSSLDRSHRLLAPGGTLVMIGAAAAVQGKGAAPPKMLGTLARFAALKLRPGARRTRMYTITGAKKADADALRRDLSTLFEWLSQGRIDPVICKVLPLDDVRVAHEMLERGEASGKIVLTLAA